MKLTVKKVKHRKLKPNSVPAEQLEVIHAIRTLGEERKLGQYKLVEGDKVRYFLNFKELRFFSNQVLRNRHKHVILVRGQSEVPRGPC